MIPHLRTHASGMMKVLYAYLLGIALSWVDIPILVVIWNRPSILLPQACYSIFTTLILTCVLYIFLHDFGEKDRKPFRWARYPAKGFVCGALGFLVVILAELILITVANEYLVVTHPHFEIDSINAYVTLILYMPFYWFYYLIAPATVLVPSVGYLSCLAPLAYVTLVSGFGYWMGYRGKRIFKNADHITWMNKLMYRKKGK